MRYRRFIDALRALEDRGDLNPIVDLFDESAELWNPELRHSERGDVGARQYWTTYRNTFAEVRSEFHNTFECDGMSALEWETHGTLRSGNQPFRYRGVTILNWENERITRMAAYFDPVALRVEHPEQVSPSVRPPGSAACRLPEEAA